MGRRGQVAELNGMIRVCFIEKVSKDLREVRKPSYRHPGAEPCRQKKH